MDLARIRARPDGDSGRKDGRHHGMSKLRIHPALLTRLIDVGGIAVQRIRKRQGSKDQRIKLPSVKIHRRENITPLAKSDSGAGRGPTLRARLRLHHNNNIHSLSIHYQTLIHLQLLFLASFLPVLTALAWWLTGTTTYFSVILFSKTQSPRNAQSGGCQLPAGFRRPLRSQRCKC